ncbi:hypothetical protein FMM75_16380 [Lachnospiraceae bacterium MD335]|nr:hypothetical protein [Lachnospiraceae bacterium MD335]
MNTDKMEKIEQTGMICFWLAFVTELVIVMVDKSAYINPIEGQLFRITFLLCCIKIAVTKYSRDEWICILLFGAVAFVSYLVNERDETVRLVAFVAACKGVDLRKMLRVAFGITLAGSVILFALSGLGLFGEFKITANFGRGEYPSIIETRYCFGMGHPNAFQCMLFMMITLCLYLDAERMKWHHFLLLEFINYFSFRYTDSNTGFLVCTAVIAGVMLMKYCKPLRKSRTIYLLGALFVIGIVVFSAIGSHTGIENELINRLDTILNGRFKFAHKIEASRLENWLPFASAANEEYFDAGFIRLFYWYGIIPGVLYVLMNLYLIYQSFREQDYTLVVIVAGYTLFTIMEAHLISFYILRNYLFIWLGYYWYQPFAKRQCFEGYFWQVRKLLVAKNGGAS